MNIEDLIKVYKNEVLMAKDSAKRFKSLNNLAYQVAREKAATYERVINDLERAIISQKAE